MTGSRSFGKRSWSGGILLGKQLEIFAIILLRNSFKSFAGVEEPISWDGMSGHMLPLLSGSFGALAIILLLAVFYRMHQRLPISESSEQRQSFIMVKKSLSLVLILCDILLVLISLGYSSLFPVVFRNSGFAVATVLLRVGITAPAYYDVGLGIAATLYAMGITLAYNLHVQGSDKQG